MEVSFKIIVLCLFCGGKLISNQEIMDDIPCNWKQIYDNICFRNAISELENQNAILNKRLNSLQSDLENRLQILNDKFEELVSKPAENNDRKDVGWLQFNNSLYFFSNLILNWFDAAKYCQENNSHLAVVTTSEEHDFLAATLNAKPPESIYVAMWLDGTDRFHEGQWIYNSTGETITLNRWYNNQPDNQLSEGENENCLAMWEHFNFMWNDNWCFEKRNFICEKGT